MMHRMPEVDPPEPNAHLKPRTLYLMQGIPASGKTTIAKGLAGHFGFSRYFSTDDFWGAQYDFDASLLGQAHGWTQANVMQAMIEGVLVIVVDNTNLTMKAISPYVDLAHKYEYDLQIIRVECPLHVALERNARRPEKRRVPDDTIRKMFEQFYSFQSDQSTYRRVVNEG